MSRSAASPSPSPSSRVSPQAVQRAVNSLLKCGRMESESQNPQRLQHDDFVYLIVTLKKVPQRVPTNPSKIPLPHPLFNPVEDSSELCLFIDDGSKSKVTKEAAMKRIKSENVPISEVIKLSKLRTDYRPFESKRKLCDSYDMFFADSRMIPHLPKLLGKYFFKKKKIPVAIDLKQQNWKEQIGKACASALFHLGSGTCSVVRVAKASMGSKEVAENVSAVIDGIADVVPSKWKNIRSFHLKLLESLALPIYQAVPDLTLRIEASSREENGESAYDVGIKKASKNNKKTKGRIHEVQYTDSDLSGMLGEEEISEDGEDSREDKVAESGGKKRKMRAVTDNATAAQRINDAIRLKKQKRSGDLGLKEKMMRKP